MTEIKWDLNPGIGIGPLKFGMTPPQVAALLGPPTSVQDFSDWADAAGELEDDISFEENRMPDNPANALPNLTYFEGLLTRATLWEGHSTFTILGRSPYADEDMSDFIAHLCATSERYVYDGDEAYIFLDLGVTLLDENIMGTGEAITVFGTGQFDRYIASAIEDGTARFIKGSL